MNPLITLNDDQLVTLLKSYSAWMKNEEDNSYINDLKSGDENLRKTLLDKVYLNKISKKDLIDEIMRYSRTLEGPAFIRLGLPRVTNTAENIKRNLLYLIESPDEPFKKAARILDGDYAIAIYAKSFWTPIFQAQYPTKLPRWNNKTTKFLKEVGINLSGTKHSTEEKYELL